MGKGRGSGFRFKHRKWLTERLLNWFLTLFLGDVYRNSKKFLSYLASKVSFNCNEYKIMVNSKKIDGKANMKAVGVQFDVFLGVRKKPFEREFLNGGTSYSKRGFIYA